LREQPANLEVIINHQTKQIGLMIVPSGIGARGQGNSMKKRNKPQVPLNSDSILHQITMLRDSPER
jgi:hypothetical protein